MKDIKVNLFVGDILFEDLPKEEQKEFSQKVSSIYAEQLFEKLIQLINNRDPKAKEYYEELCKCIVKN
ncbi:hypothetical protein SAMN05446037_1008153 [Anaerovirgula multivorans]|uniref:Uncharacterized protein n=1 Tax=Anaerovirgula multivorans TaxID=312168 RepID=A0A239DX43_9FIRM|nr:hypothetical protein [Anaerovirgula multivorans]SNS36263.1 hypothetical protein SAMN05446037_1008153 [Anaerovirgula multivorans]